MTITAQPTSLAPVAPARRVVWRHGLGAAVVAATVVTALAAVASAAGVPLADEAGQEIPLLGFTQLTFVFSMVGVGIASILARKASRPRRTFVQTTVVLTVVSLVPDVAYDFGAATALTLMALHLVAAAIVIPALANRLHR